ncbi:hypothetical protein [Nostoc sp.]|uniref:hypothetical protein n=1 Tax=Nostoc sp. TaxID=1180 RepID=UPI002FF81E41
MTLKIEEISSKNFKSKVKKVFSFNHQNSNLSIDVARVSRHNQHQTPMEKKTSHSVEITRAGSPTHCSPLGLLSIPQ